MLQHASYMNGRPCTCWHTLFCAGNAKHDVLHCCRSMCHPTGNAVATQCPSTPTLFTRSRLIRRACHNPTTPRAATSRAFQHLHPCVRPAMLAVGQGVFAAGSWCWGERTAASWCG
jgi:hypothetical protein